MFNPFFVVLMNLSIAAFNYWRGNKIGTFISGIAIGITIIYLSNEYQNYKWRKEHQKWWDEEMQKLKDYEDANRPR